MDSDLSQQAIQAAIHGDWRTAEKLNRLIIQQNPIDLDCLLRLANATSQLGKVKESVELYEKILKLDPHNIFATRNLDRLKKLKSQKKKDLANPHTLLNEFLEEAGKTKTVILVRPAPFSSLARLDTGEPVLLVPRRRRIVVTSQTGVYVGRLPDDLSIRLLGFIRGGNQYEAIVKSVIDDHVKIFIHETVRSEKFANVPSFAPDIQTNHEEA